MSESLIIQIPLGLPGLAACTSYELRARSPGSAYAWLRATSGQSVELLAIDVLTLRKDYPIDQLRRSLAFLHLDDDEPLLALALCTVPHAPATATANLLAPVVVGLRSRKAAQIVLHDPRWTDDAPLPG